MASTNFISHRFDSTRDQNPDHPRMRTMLHRFCHCVQYKNKNKDKDKDKDEDKDENENKNKDKRKNKNKIKDK